MASSPLLVIFGSGPGIGIHIAKAFARTHFNNIVLCSRDTARLELEKKEIEETIERPTKVTIFTIDMLDLDGLKSKLKQIEALGPLGCVYHNAARLQETQPLKTSVEDVMDEYKIGVASLYAIAQWAIPLMEKNRAISPAFFHTNSHFPEQPRPPRFSLAMAKAGQQNLFMTLNQVFGEHIHFGVIKVSGIVSADKKKLNPRSIADSVVRFYEQEKKEWTLLLKLSED